MVVLKICFFRICFQVFPTIVSSNINAFENIWETGEFGFFFHFEHTDLVACSRTLFDFSFVAELIK